MKINKTGNNYSELLDKVAQSQFPEPPNPVNPVDSGLSNPNKTPFEIPLHCNYCGKKMPQNALHYGPDPYDQDVYSETPGLQGTGTRSPLTPGEKKMFWLCDSCYDNAADDI